MAASMRVASFLARLSCQKNVITSPFTVINRCYRKRLFRELQALYRLRTEIGPEPERPRSVWSNWNYNCELFAFGKRLGEDLSDDVLKTVFSHRLYIKKENAKRLELGLDLVEELEETPEEDRSDNEQLAKEGEELCSKYIQSYLRTEYPLMFEEGIEAIHDYLTSDKMFNYISRRLGTTDLVLSVEFPVSNDSVIKSFKALIGAILEEKGKGRAELFIRDFILPQLIGKDINEMWDIVNPMGLLSAMLNYQQRGLPEPRLLWECGSSTIMAVYHVGIYSDKKLIGKAPGETVEIAEEMAARDAIKKILKTADNRPPLHLGKMAESREVDEKRVNVSAKQFIRQYSPKEEEFIAHA